MRRRYVTKSRCQSKSTRKRSLIWPGIPQYNGPSTIVNRLGKVIGYPQKQPSSNQGVIYGLFATDEPDQIRYVGATIKDPLIRLDRHIKKPSFKMATWINEVSQRGEKINMEILGSYTLTELSPAEAAWTLYYRELGTLLNSGIRPTHYLRFIRQKTGERA